MNASLEPQDLQQFVNISVSLVSLCIHSLVLLMATEGQISDQPQAASGNAAVWTEPETDALINYLLAAKEKMGDSGMFKKSTFRTAAEHIRPLHTIGSVKTEASCRTKYSSVCNITH